jgi:hypothetical protein
LAMLYVPLLFYIFDRLSERFKEKKDVTSREENTEGRAQEDVPHDE